MKETEYDRIERKTESGIKLCMEFPKRTETDGKRIPREVKEILTGVLREHLRKTGGNE